MLFSLVFGSCLVSLVLFHFTFHLSLLRRHAAVHMRMRSQSQRDHQCVIAFLRYFTSVWLFQPEKVKETDEQEQKTENQSEGNEEGKPEEEQKEEQKTEEGTKEEKSEKKEDEKEEKKEEAKVDKMFCLRSLH